MKTRFLFSVRTAIFISLSVGFLPVTAHAGFLDKLNTTDIMNTVTSVLNSIPKPSDDTTSTTNGSTAKTTSATTTTKAPTITKASAATTSAAKSVPTATAATAQPMVQKASITSDGVALPQDAGTEEGTAALAKVIPDIGAGAFTLGMPLEKAMDEMKSAKMFDDPFARPQYAYKFNQLPNVTFVVGSYGLVKHDTGRENVGLAYTMYPSKPVVTTIFRSYMYTPQNAPNMETMLSALRKKYGQESGYGNGNRIYWVYDYKGNPLSKDQLATLKKKNCYEAFNGSSLTYSEGMPRPEELGNKIAKGYAQIYYGTDKPDLDCFAISYVNVRLNIYTPGTSVNNWGEHVYIDPPGNWEKYGSDLVETIFMTVDDVALDYSASEASRNAILNNGQQIKKNQTNAAKKNKADL